MRRVHIDDIEEGMVLARQVVDKRGVIIVNAGFVVSPAWRKRLDARDIDYIFVLDEDEANVDSQSETQQNILSEKINQSVDSMFEGTMQLEIMASLSQAAKRYLRKKKLGIEE